MSKNLKVSKEHSGVLTKLIEHQDVLSFWLTWLSFDDLKNHRLISKKIQEYINESCTLVNLNITIKPETDLSRLWSQLSIFWSKLKRLEETNLTFDDDSVCSLEISFLNSDLYQLTTLMLLDLEDTGVENISFLINCPNLEFLNISNTFVKDLSVLRHLKKIQTLYANGQSFENVNSLGGCSLLYLELMDCNGLKNVSCLQKCLNLVSINLHRSNDLSTFWESGNLSKIEILDLEETCLSNFSFLITDWTLLVSVNLSYTNIKDIESLHQAINLETLRLDGLELTSIVPLVTCKNIETLSLRDNNRIISVETIGQLKNLKKLDILGVSEEILGISSILNCQLLESLFIDEKLHQEIEDSLSSQIRIYDG